MPHPPPKTREMSPHFTERVALGGLFAPKVASGFAHFPPFSSVFVAKVHQTCILGTSAGHPPLTRGAVGLGPRTLKGPAQAPQGVDLTRPGRQLARSRFELAPFGMGFQGKIEGTPTPFWGCLKIGDLSFVPSQTHRKVPLKKTHSSCRKPLDVQFGSIPADAQDDTKHVQ